MRHLLMLHADEETEEADVLPDGPSPALDAYDRELVRAGVLLVAERLAPGAEGARIDYDGERRTVVAGSMRASGAGVRALWMLETAGMDEAIEWARRLPLRRGTVEVRPVRDEGAAPRPVAVLRG